MQNVLLPYTYFGNLEWYLAYLGAESVTLEQHEYFEKQTYRNRCTIYGANGALNLIVPVHRIRQTRQFMQDIRITYAENWQKLHWRSLESAYRRSPYFEYYEADFKPLFEEKYERLIDLNQATTDWVLTKLDLDAPTTSSTDSYEAEPEATDLRRAFNPKAAAPAHLQEARYLQTFESKYGFLPNLSVLDLLFNQGPAGASYLMGLMSDRG